MEPPSRRSPVHKTTVPSSVEHQPSVLGPISASPPPCSAPSAATGTQSDAEFTVVAQVGNAANRETHANGCSASTLFLQLNVEELGVCFPINILQVS